MKVERSRKSFRGGIPRGPGVWVAAFLVLALSLAAAAPAAAGWKVVGCSLVWEGPVPTETRCYFDTYWRPASILTECPGADKSGLLCYPFCSPGYSGVGPVCWQQCPSGYADDGAFCRRNGEIIGADNSDCPWYDKCGLTFARGCSRCPQGYSNDGCTCRIDPHIFAKSSYWRGAGWPLSCAPGKEQLGLLCYDSCRAGYHSDGVFCTANEQTCREVPVTPTPMNAFCFELKDPQSQVRPCIPTKVYADTEANARQLAQCQCTNCSVSTIPCTVFEQGQACH